MKAITTTLYVCSGLMIAAAVMGAVDYSSASRKGTLDKLYKEEKPEVKAPPAPKEIDLEDYSRGEINRPEETPLIAVAKKETIKKEKTKVAKAFSKKKKRLNYKQFSRSAIEEPVELIDSVVAKK